MSNEAFHLLSRGGVKFEKSKHESLLFQVSLSNCVATQKNYSRSYQQPYQKSKNIKAKEATLLKPLEGSVPLELDFFKYAQGGQGKRKQTSASHSEKEEKRRKLDVEEQADENEDDDEELPATQKGLSIVHRVSAKGSNIPPSVDSFEAMVAQGVSSRIMTNLKSSGYKEPTNVQASCIPILLQAS